MTTLRMGLELSGCFCNFAYLKESVLGKCRCSSGQHAFKPHLQDLQWMQFRTTNLNIFARRHRQGHVCRKAYLSLPSQLLPSTLNTLPEQHNTHTHTFIRRLINILHPNRSERGNLTTSTELSPRQLSQTGEQGTTISRGQTS